MKFLYKMERKFGKYAIHNLSFYVVACFLIGYLLSMFAPEIYQYVVFSPYYVIVEHQYWRLFTWIFTEPGPFSILTLISLFCYGIFGTSVERRMGTFFYNIYIFGGLFITTVSVLAASIISYYTVNDINDYAEFFLDGIGAGYSLTLYMTFGFMLGYAVAFSDAIVLVFFALPFKVKWLAYIDIAYLTYLFVKTPFIISRVSIVASVANVLIFYLIVRKSKGRLRPTAAQMTRKRNFDRQVRAVQEKQMQPGVTRHKCAVCGRTEKDGDELEFRFCSKCKGNYEYCQEHLFTHEHIK